jgi:hypothetical protein
MIKLMKPIQTIPTIAKLPLKSNNIFMDFQNQNGARGSGGGNKNKTINGRKNKNKSMHRKKNKKINTKKKLYKNKKTNRKRH